MPGGGTPGGLPQPSGRSGSSPGAGSEGSSGSSGDPTGQGRGDLPGAGGGQNQPSWNPGTGGGLPGSDQDGGSSGDGDRPGAAGGDEGSWEDGTPGGSGDDGWQTSNQLPSGDGDSRIPPMPSERDKPAGSGDSVLDGALEDFDGEILSEREVIRSRSNETAGRTGSNLPSTGAGGQRGDGDGQPAGGGGESDVAIPGGPMGVPSNRNAPPAPNPVASANVPEDIPDAKDDDIIARQLREAAMQESDPELREKLWEEYRRYKGI